MICRIKAIHCLAGLAIAFASGALPGFVPRANAQTFSSSYTSTAPKDCRTIGKPSELDGSTTRVCPGKAGLVVLISEDDLREIVSVGRTRTAAASEPAAEVWFGFVQFDRAYRRVARRRWQAIRDHPALANRG